MMKILFVISTLGGGPGTVLTTLVQKLGDRFDFSVIAMSSEISNEALDRAGMRVRSSYSLGRGGKVDLRAYRSFSNICNEVSPCLVMSFDFASNMYAWWRLGRRGVPWLPCVRGLESAFVWWRVPMQRRAFRSAKTIVVPSSAVKEKLIQSRIVTDEAIRVIPNGTVMPQYQTKRISPASGDIVQLVYVAEFYSEIKGHRVAIEAMKYLPERYQLVLVGDGVMRPEMEQLTDDLGMHRRVTFTGHLDREGVEAKLNSSHAFLASTLSESFGLGMVEAMSLGLPAVASNVGGIPDIVKHGENGLLVPPGDPDALAQAIQTLFSDRDEYGRLSRNARETVESSFTAERMVQRYSETFLETVEGASS